MEEIFNLFNINFDTFTVLKGKKTKVSHTHYVVGRFAIIVVSNPSKEFMKDLETIKSDLATQGKQLIILNKSEVKAFPKLFNMLTYLSSYNNKNI